MPEWLRKRLVWRLPEARLSQARSALKAYLESAHEGRSTGGWLEFLHPRRRDQGDPNILSDFVFLGMMWGLKPDELSAHSPGVLSRLLFQKGNVMFGIQPLIQFAMASLLAADSGPVPAPPRFVSLMPCLPAATPPEDPFLWRVREVSESQVGLTQASGLWRSPFVDWTFDQAAQLLGTATPLLAPSGTSKGVVDASQPGFGIAIDKSPSVSASANYVVSARGGTVQNYGLPVNAKYQDLRPSSRQRPKVAVVSTSVRVPFAEVQRFVAAVQKVGEQRGRC
jgi:hypothetical protein